MGFSYLSKQGRKKLPNYNYKGRDRSLFYKYVASPACNKLVEYFPTWLAPNMITLLGLLIMMVSHFIVYKHLPEMEGEAPTWVVVQSAVATLVYQTLDNLDGKQARRTGSASPLGLIFDHGVDALVTTFGGLSMTAIVQCGMTWKTLVFWICGSLGFFMASWEEYFTGEFDLPIINGPNEGILLLAGLQLLTAWRGASLWTSDSIIEGVPNNTILVLFFFVGAILTVLQNMHTVYKSKRRLKQKIPFCKTLKKALPFLLVEALAYFWFTESRGNAVAQHTRLFIWTLGLIFAKMVMLLIVAHMCNEEYQPWRRSIMPLFFVGFHAVRSLVCEGAFPSFDEKRTIEDIFIVSLLAYVHMIWTLIRDCCKVLDVHCLTIKKKTGGKKKSG